MASSSNFTPNVRSKFISRLGSIPQIASILARVLPPLDVPLMRWSKGKYSLTSIVTSLPIVSLTTTGAKSGLARTMPLIAIREETRFVLIASNFGQYNNPAWFYNLKANPQAQIEVAGEVHECVAYQAEGEEREKYWQKAVDYYSGYAAYKKNCSHRKIPVMVLDIQN